MAVRRLRFGPALLVVGSAASLVACNGHEPARSAIQEPFGFVELRELAKPIERITPKNRTATASRLEAELPHVSELFGDALARYESIYGDGVGPARGSRDFMGCKATFRQVGVEIDRLQPGDTASRFDGLWAELEHCRDIALGWSGPAEMATFGNDLKAMTEGAMLALSCTAAVAGLPSATRYYHAAIASEAGDDPPA